MSTGRIKHFIDGHRITWIVVLCLFGLCLINASSRPEKKPSQKDDDKIYLVHADELLYDKYGPGMMNDAQVVRGSVVLESRGARLKCDSAYFYQSRNSVIVVGNVIYTSGDTLTMTCDSATYEGNTPTPVFRAFSRIDNHRVHYIKGDTLKVECRKATYTSSKERADEKKLEAREDVVLNHKGRLLKTDNLNYVKNGSEEKAWYFEGGRMDDAGKFLSSDWGMYYLDSKKAEFFYNVKMRNGKWFVKTDKLYYDASTSTAHIEGESTIRNDEDAVIVSTTKAFYNSKNDAFELFNRSMIRDSVSHVRLEADSIFYDKSIGKGEGFGKVEYVDTLRKREMYGDYVYYDEINGDNKGFGNVHVVDYGDNREITCDTLYANNQTKTNKGFGNVHIQDYGRKMEMTCDRVFSNDDTGEKEGIGNVYIIDHERQTEMTCGRLISNDILGDNEGFENVVYIDHKNKNEMYGNYFQYNKLSGEGYATDEAWLKDYSQEDTLYVRADTIRLKTFDIDTDSVYREVYCYYNVRAFRRDVQAICDSLMGCSRDSSMTMYLQPVVWSDNRQIRGEEIKVYAADSTIREAHVKGQALSIEKIDEENHYNQISSDKLDSYFIDGVLRKSVAMGNVKVLFYPADEKTDSLMFLDNTETDTLKIFLSEERQLQKMWTSKHKSVLYPMTQIPPDKYKLSEFIWLDDLRPKDKDDIFNVRQMTADQQQTITNRPAIPLNRFDDNQDKSVVPQKEDEEVTNE